MAIRTRLLLEVIPVAFSRDGRDCNTGFAACQFSEMGYGLPTALGGHLGTVYTSGFTQFGSRSPRSPASRFSAAINDIF